MADEKNLSEQPELTDAHELTPDQLDKVGGGAKLNPPLRFHLEDVLVSSYQTSGSGGGY